VPTILLRDEGWATEPPESAGLLNKIRGGHPTLAEVAQDSLYRGIIPGLTEAFFIDQQTRDRLVSEDPACEPLLRKAIRGKNVGRWRPSWDGEWIILLKSSETHSWPWANAGSDAERVFGESYPSLYRRLKPLQAALQKRQDRGRHWWELRACSYYDHFAKPKILYPDISFHSSLCYDDQGLFCNNTCYFLPTEERWILAALNSSVMWWYLARQATHGKDEAFRLHTQFMRELPIPKPGDDIRRELNDLVDHLRETTADRRAHGQQFFAKLAADLSIERPSTKLEQFWRLDSSALASELRRAAPAAVGTRAQALADEYEPFVAEARRLLADTVRLEARVQRLVFELYGLTPDEVTLLRASAPPRDPLALAEAEAHILGVYLPDSGKTSV
jgi:hypothetical protein